MSEGNEGSAGGAASLVSGEIEPEAKKKLRFSEPDLKITIGGCSDTKKSDGEEQLLDDNNVVVKWYHAVIMARHSNYIDAMLSNPMKESGTNELNFPDITPEVWDLMMKFVEDPSEARHMTIKDVMLVAKYYDKYDFPKGRKLSSDVLVDYFQTVDKNEKSEPPDVDAIIDAVLLAEKMNLEGAKKAGMDYLHDKFTSVEVPYGRTMFNKAHIQKLSPLLAANKHILPWGLKKEDVLSPTFPRLYVMDNSRWIASRMLQDSISYITLAGTGCAADGDFDGPYNYGEFETDRKVNWDGVEVTFKIQKHHDNWAIVRCTLPDLDEDGHEDYDSVVSTICWESPCSENLPLPPRSN